MSDAVLELDEDIQLDELVKMSVTLKNQIDVLDAERKSLNGEREIINRRIFEIMEATGQRSTSTDLGTALITEAMKPHYTDKEAAFAYIKENDAMDLLPASIPVNAYKERLEAGEPMVGIDHYTKRDIRVSRRR